MSKVLAFIGQDQHSAEDLNMVDGQLGACLHDCAHAAVTARNRFGQFFD